MQVTHLYDSAERQHYLFRHQYSMKLKPRLLYVGNLKKSQGWTEKLHTHEFCEIIYVVDGHGCITLENEQRNVKKGDLIIYNPGVLHAEESSKAEPLEIRFMALDRLEITDLPKNHLLPPEYDSIYSTGKYGDLIHAEFDRMITEFENSEAFYVEIAESIARTLMMYVIRIINKQDTNASIFQSNRNLNLALNYIKEHYHENILLEDIADYCHLNKYYLSHLFTQLQGVSIGKYVQNLRINESMKLLRETNEPVAAIAQEVGFKDAGHFCRTFKKETSFTPLQYRKSEVLTRPDEENA